MDPLIEMLNNMAEEDNYVIKHILKHPSLVFLATASSPNFTNFPSFKQSTSFDRVSIFKSVTYLTYTYAPV